MRKKLCLGFGCLAILILCILAWVVFGRESEPEYKGKPLSFWLWAYDSQTYYYIYPAGFPVPPEHEANLAIQKMGIKAAEILVRMLSEKNPRLKLLAWELSLQQRAIKFKYPVTNPYYKALCALRGLGASASNVVPHLLRLWDNNNSPFPQQAVPIILGDIGPSAAASVPALIRRLNHTNDIVRFNAIRALALIRAAPATVVPALVKLLGDPEIHLRTQAAGALGLFGRDAVGAVPALLVLWTNQIRVPLMPAGYNPMAGIDLTWNIEWKSLPADSAPDEAGTVRDALNKIDPETARKAGVDSGDDATFQRRSLPRMRR